MAEFLNSPAPRDDLGGYIRNKYVPYPRGLGEELSHLITTKVDGSLYVILRRSLEKQYINKATAQRVLQTLEEHDLTCTHPLFESWCGFVNNENVHFERVKSIEITNQPEDGYDLTVPGFETFMSLDGVILSNTLQIHVPAAQKAVDEVKGMTLSNLLFGDKTKSDLLVFPQHEAIAGIHMASNAKGGKTYKFKTKDEALKAYRRGEIGLTDTVKIG